VEVGYRVVDGDRVVVVVVRPRIEVTVIVMVEMGVV
jgi:hypothetical protein